MPKRKKRCCGTNIYFQVTLLFCTAPLCTALLGAPNQTEILQQSPSTKSRNHPSQVFYKQLRSLTKFQRIIGKHPKITILRTSDPIKMIKKLILTFVLLKYSTRRKSWSSKTFGKNRNQSERIASVTITWNDEINSLTAKLSLKWINESMAR